MRWAVTVVTKKSFEAMQGTSNARMRPEAEETMIVELAGACTGDGWTVDGVFTEPSPQDKELNAAPSHTPDFLAGEAAFRAAMNKHTHAKTAKVKGTTKLGKPVLNSYTIRLLLSDADGKQAEETITLNALSEVEARDGAQKIAVERHPHAQTILRHVVNIGAPAEARPEKKREMLSAKKAAA